MGSGPQVALVEGAPDLLSLHRSHPGRYPFLLQSVDSQCASGRFDILFAFPGSTLALGRDGRVRFDGNATPGAGFLAALDETWRSLGAAKTSHHELPFRGGWFIYLGYELAAELESRLSLPRAPWPGLDACAVRIPAALIRDHAKRRTWAVCEAHNELVSARAAIATMREDVAAAEGSPSPALHALGPVREEPPQRFVGGIERIRRYIRAGDVFQVNLSRLWTVPVPAATHPADLYRRLRARNPAPFSGLAQLPDGSAILSSSPERLVEVRGRTVRTKPIAGTYPRGRNAAEDAARVRELLRHPKERAEHVMLIDLERNDLGRICRAGSVEVAELMTVETYRHVHHIVSEVRGELNDAVTPGAAIAAVFPGGTITGCPKVRCMQIIAELERAPRLAYTGSMGYLDRSGDLDLNILIRTMVKRAGELTFRAGAGIVWDSVPRREIRETRNKARGMLAALEYDGAYVENAG